MAQPAQMTVRPARPGDRVALGALVDRCSAETLYRRFHGPVTATVAHELDRIAAPGPDHRSWVAVSPGDGTIHGTATLAHTPLGTSEAAVLVEDGWRRAGIGRRMLAALAVEARRAGTPEINATVQADNEGALRFLRSIAPGLRSRWAGGTEVEVALPVASLPAVHPAAPIAPIVRSDQEAA
jgi:GNAT superfamily N-acetyltransferase